MIKASIYDGFGVTDKVVSIPVIFDRPIYNNQRFYLKNAPAFIAGCAINKIAVMTGDVTINSLVSTSFALTLVDNQKNTVLTSYPLIDLVMTPPGGTAGCFGKLREFDISNINMNASFVSFFAPVGAPPEVVNFRLLLYYTELKK